MWEKKTNVERLYIPRASNVHNNKEIKNAYFQIIYII
jgi:hypothetical protein